MANKGRGSHILKIMHKSYIDGSKKAESESTVRLHSAVLAAASGFWREILADADLQGDLHGFLLLTKDSFNTLQT